MYLVGNHSYHLSEHPQEATLCNRVSNHWATNELLTEDALMACLEDGADVDCNRCLLNLAEVLT